MTECSATIEWKSSGGFTEGRYSRAHRWTFDGGASVLASSSPSIVPVPLSDPAGVDPEEALTASASACHMLWFLHLAYEAGFDVAGYTDEACGTVGRIAPGKVGLTRVTLKPRIVYNGREPSAEELERLHHEAHERCFIANSLRGEVVVE